MMCVLFTFSAEDSLFISFMIAAKASGLTPFSHKLTKILNVYLSNYVFNICDISYKTKEYKKDSK